MFLLLTFVLISGFLFNYGQGSMYQVHAQSLDKGEITASSLNIRSQPTSSSSVIGGYARGAKVDLHEKTGSWYKVKFNNRWGYIHGSYVKVTTSNSPSSSTIGTGEVTASKLNVRASASTSSAIVSSIRKGTKEDLHGKTGDWYKIKMGSQWGYIHGKYVKVTSTSSNSDSSGEAITAPADLDRGEVTASNLNVRASASTNSKIISSLRKGTKVDLQDKTGDWYKVKIGSRSGYIHGKYVKEIISTSSGSDSSGDSSSEPVELERGEVTASNLNVRSSASTSSAIISSLRKGTKVDLLGKTGDWFEIKVGNRSGYIHGKYVKVSIVSSGSDSSEDDNSAPAELKRGEVTATNLNVRASSSSSSSIISSLRRGKPVDLHEKTGDWYKVKVDSGWGYIHANYVKISTNSSSEDSSTSGSLSGKKVFLDAGHGGKDPGAVNGNVYEKTIVLDLTNKLKQALEREGAKVFISRSNDTFIPIGTRVTLANQSNSDLFISIHANAFGSPAVNGSEVLYNETQYPRESLKLASELQKAISSGMNMRDRGLVKRNLQVIAGPKMPAVLIEPGFMTNSADLDKLLNQQDKMVNEIVRGIKAYYK